MDHSIQITNEWVRQIDELISWEDSGRSFRVLRVALQALRN